MPGSATATEGSPPPTTSTTSDGFIVGVEPAKTPAQIQAEQNPAPPSDPAPQQQTNGERMFTETQVETFRQQEKDKVYGRIDSMAAELDTLKAERETERAAQEAAVAEAEAEAKRVSDDEMDVRDLLKQNREEFQNELKTVRDEADRANAMLEKERQLNELTAYRDRAVASVADRLVPEITDFISGDTPEQIDASIVDALERSERIVQGALAAQQQQLQGMQGTRTTNPSASGPLEEQQEQRQITPDDIRNMTPSEYAASRGTLQKAGREQFYAQQR